MQKGINRFCNKEITPDMKFCKECGYKLK
ncbi:MAG: zinc-ribbon domain-containing protein [Methanosarcinales archaeon]